MATFPKSECQTFNPIKYEKGLMSRKKHGRTHNVMEVIEMWLLLMPFWHHFKFGL